MSGTARAIEKRRRTRGDAHLKRPAHLPQNAPLPRYSWAVQHLMIPSDAIIYAAIESLPDLAELPGGVTGQGRLLDAGAASKIAKATARFMPGERAMSRRTVAYRLVAMTKKAMLEPDEQLHRNHPDGRRYRLRPYKETLEAIRGNPENAVAGKGFYTCGKARRICTREEMLAWGADLNQEPGPGAPLQVMQPIDLGEAVARTRIERPRKKAETPAEALEVILEALDATTAGASDKDAERLYTAVLERSGSHPPDAELLAEFIRRIHADQPKRASQPPADLRIGKALIRELLRRVDSWRRKQRKARRAEVFERDERINKIAGYLRELERQDLPPPDRDAIVGWLATFPPEEVDAARKLL